MLLRLLRWLGYGLVGEARALGDRLTLVEDAVGIDRAITELTRGKGE